MLGSGFHLLSLMTVLPFTAPPCLGRTSVSILKSVVGPVGSARSATLDDVLAIGDRCSLAPSEPSVGDKASSWVHKKSTMANAETITILVKMKATLAYLARLCRFYGDL